MLTQDVFPNIKMYHLPRIFSDHTTLCLKWQEAVNTRKNHFIFQRMWTDHLQFKQVVQRIWRSHFHGSLGMVLNKKLNQVRYTLKGWNWNIFGDNKAKILQLTQ